MGDISDKANKFLDSSFQQHVYFLILHRASIPPKGIVKNSYCTCITLEYCSPVFHHAIIQISQAGH